MIRRLQLVNFRSYADATLPLQPISVLIGPVGAGKSNVFKAMVLLQTDAGTPVGIERQVSEMVLGKGFRLAMVGANVPGARVSETKPSYE